MSSRTCSKRSQRTIDAHPAAAASEFSSHVTFKQTSAGHSSLVGREGHGSFSATRHGSAAVEAYALAAVTGVPLPEIAKGGSYKLREDVGSTVTGTLVAQFKAKGLGTLCLTLTGSDASVINGYFEPTIGTLKTVGGTGAAAHWRLTTHWHLTKVSPGATMGYRQSGATTASVAGAKAMSATCRSVAKQR